MPTTTLRKIGLKTLHKMRSPAKSKRRSDNPYRRYERDPVGFIREVLEIEPTVEQIAICESVLTEQTTCVQAAHGVGKTAIAAGIALWYIYAVEGVVISTAPTARQVNALLWKEIRRGKVRGELPGEVFKTPKLEFIPNIAYGFGFTAKDNNSNAFQGSHDVKQMIIVDEACGISPEIWEGAVSCLTGSLNRLLAIGNPIKTNTPFHEECSRRSLHVPVWNHPNVRWAYEKHPDGIHRLKPEIYRLIMDEKGRVKEDWPDSPSLKEDAIPGAISVRWIEQMARPRGEKSSFWLTRVEGRFAYDSENSLISRQWFREARYRYDSDPDYWNHVASVHPYRAGLDVGDGSDPHAVVTWRGPLLQFAREIPTTGDRLDIVRAAGAGINHLRQYGGTLAVDRTGVGSGAHSIIQEAINHAIDQSIADDLATFVEGEIQLSGCVAEGIAWGSKPIAGAGTTPIDQLINLKIQQAWLLREAFQYGEVAIAPLGEVEQLLEDELCGIYWDDTSKGQLRIEDKAKTRKRLRRSPNLADATIMGYAANASILTADMFSVIKKD